MRGPGPVKTPLLICALFGLALYLAAQYAVNLTTFNDACREDVRWAAVLNFFNLLAAIVLFAFAAVSVYSLAGAAQASLSSDASAPTSSSSAASEEWGTTSAPAGGKR